MELADQQQQQWQKNRTFFSKIKATFDFKHVCDVIHNALTSYELASRFVRRTFYVKVSGSKQKKTTFSFETNLMWLKHQQQCEWKKAQIRELFIWKICKIKTANYCDSHKKKCRKKWPTPNAKQRQKSWDLRKVHMEHWRAAIRVINWKLNWFCEMDTAHKPFKPFSMIKCKYHIFQRARLKSRRIYAHSHTHMHRENRGESWYNWCWRRS